MRIAVVGATGMVGSAMARVLRAAGHDIWPTRSPDTLSDELDVVVNCAGSVPERGDSAADMIAANAVLPHRLAAHCDRIGARLIHISTDCVFGTRGPYKEDDTPDADTLYGRSKALGEVGAPHLTIRTSVIGHGGQYGLVNWLMRQQGEVPGWAEAWWTGMTNVELAKVVDRYILPNPYIMGVRHVVCSRTTKYMLLLQIAQEYGLPVRIKPVSEPRSRRVLNAQQFAEETGYEGKSRAAMIEQMHRDYLAR